MKKCIAIDVKAYKAAKTDAERQAVINASHIPLTPQEIAQRQKDEADYIAELGKPKPKSQEQRILELEQKLAALTGEI